jgi:hypothetical protein
MPISAYVRQLAIKTGMETEKTYLVRLYVCVREGLQLCRRYGVQESEQALGSELSQKTVE